MTTPGRPSPSPWTRRAQSVSGERTYARRSATACAIRRRQKSGPIASAGSRVNTRTRTALAGSKYPRATNFPPETTSTTAPASSPDGGRSTARLYTQGCPARRCRTRSFCSSSFTGPKTAPRTTGQAGLLSAASLPCVAPRANDAAEFPGLFFREENVMKRLLVALALAALVLPAAALADSEFSIVLQGGATKYNQSLSGSDVGAAYGARLGIMPTPMLGVEVGYLGSQNNINESLNQGRLASTLKTNEGYGDVRLNILPGEFTPYIFGGYGYTWVNGAEASGIPNSSTHTLPFGGGVEANIGAFKLGGRVPYNYLFNDINTGSHTVSLNKGGNFDFLTATVDLRASFPLGI